MSSILVDFEVLPEASRTELTAVQVYDELKRQIADPHSLLWNGDFGRYAAKAELRPSSGDVGGDTLRSARSSHGPDEFGEATAGAYSRSQPASAGGAFPSQGHWPQQGPGSHHDAPGELPSRFNSNDWQGAGLSGSEAVDRFDYFERQLKKTAAGGYRPQDLPTPAANARGHNGSGGSVEVEALEEKSIHLQHRLEVVERELRDALEASRMHRAKAEQAELKLKDREQLLVHAKEMWMKENVRASKLADALTSAEDKLADTEKRLGEVTSRYNEAQQEVRQLQHVLGAPRENGFGGDSRKLDFIPKTASPTNFAKVGRSPSNFDDPFRDDVPGGGGGGMVRPSTAMGIETLDGGKSLPMPPLEAETNADRFNRLCLLNDAVLYEDELLQIGIKGEYAGRDGQVAVYFGNKSSASLEAFTVQYFVREEEALRLSASPVNQSLGADKQVVQRIAIVCMRPFADTPWLRVQFLLPDTTPRRIQIRFPVVLTKFMAGKELPPQDFFRYWRKQQYQLNEVAKIVQLAERMQGPLVHVARSVSFGGALRMHSGVDTNPDNFVLVGQLTGPSPSTPDRDVDRGLETFGIGSDHDSGLALVRVEVGSGRFAGKARVVVRSSDHTVACALCDGILTQLAEPSMPHQLGGAVSK